jgi:ferredoxin-fold anticodon binding domain-containing protein
MKARASKLAILFALVACAAFAHGNKVHVLGTLEKINPDSVLVKTKEGKSVEVRLVASTVYVLHVASSSGSAADMNEDKPAKISDLAVGDVVVIHATPKDNTLEADEVRFSVPVAVKAAPPAPAKPKS